MVCDCWNEWPNNTEELLRCLAIAESQMEAQQDSAENLLSAWLATCCLANP
jgi:hypothetical protein